MADWQIVRFDPAYEEKLDAEIIPLCDALNAAGFVTTTSCCGHGTRWPYVTFDPPSDAEAERLARFVMATEQGDFRQHYTVWQREVLPEGCRWWVHIHCNEVYGDTPTEEAMRQYVLALADLTRSVWNFRSLRTEEPQ